MENGNLANYKNDEVTEILRDLYNISDERTYIEKYEKLQNIYQEERMYIGLYFDRRVIVHGTNLLTTPNNSWFNIFYDIENWKRKN